MTDMFKVFRKEIDWAGRKLVLETGKIARQADGAVLATYGGTTVLATVVYETAFDGFDLGHAGAIGLLWMILLMALVVVYVRLSEKGENR